jgi:hypothetical protein
LWFFLTSGRDLLVPVRMQPQKKGGGVIDNLPEGRENAKYDILFIKRNMFLRIISSSRVILALIKSDNYIGSKYVET